MRSRFDVNQKPAANLLPAQMGIPCTVFEKDASIDERTRDWDFGIYWAQSPLNDCLPNDLRSEIFNAQVDDVKPSADTYLPAYNGETGEELKKIPAPYYLRLRRRDLSKVLGSGIDIRVSLFTRCFLTYLAQTPSSILPRRRPIFCGMCYRETGKLTSNDSHDSSTGNV